VCVSYGEVDGLFLREIDRAALAQDREIRPIDLDSRRKREIFESAKFSFEIKSGRF